ncbi:MAG: N-methyl-L-tryptophan oxidase [Planctomycetaceae bacterium]|nr:N-methyl-L-tryptophan oxidase [Planctomycetaceae bacterium]
MTSMHRPMKQIDAIVLGLGGMGASALAAIAGRGIDVLGIDQEPAAHARGSSHGGSRIIRRAYFEHPDYVPLLEAAFEGWRRLERTTDSTCFQRTGVLLVGASRSPIIEASRSSAETHGVPVELLGSDQMRIRFPQFASDRGWSGLFEPDAGIVDPEAGIRAHLEAARRAGASIRRPLKVLSVDGDDREAVVRTDQGALRTNRLVVAAGAWTASLLGDRLRVPLVPHRKAMVWFEPVDARSCSSAEMPAWLIDEGDAGGCYYGVPTWPGQPSPAGVKIGWHGSGTVVDPDASHEVGSEVIERFTADLEDRLPGVFKRPVAAQACLYTMSPDEHFVIDRLPGRGSMIVVAGFSGHGYKFAPVVGEIAADLAIDGATGRPAAFLGLNRFEADRPG